MPDLITVSCQRCQSRIDVPTDAMLATCGRCGARLAVRRSDTAVWTEIIEDAEVEPPANVTREEFDALKRRIELEELERDALTQAGLAIAGQTGRLMVPMAAPKPNARGDVAAPRWIDAAAMRRRVSLFALLIVLPVAGCALSYALPLILNGNWVIGLLCLSGAAMFVSPGIIGFILSHRRLNAYEAEQRAYEVRRSAILAPNDPSADEVAAGSSSDVA